MLDTRSEPRLSFDSGQIVHSGCQACGGRIRPLFDKDTPDGRYVIVRCDSCGFGFVNPTPSMAAIMAFYEKDGHSHHFEGGLADLIERERQDPNSTVDAARFAARLKQHAPGSRLLDVGCGYGFFSHAAKQQGFEVTSLEIAETEADFAAEMLGERPLAVTFEAFETEDQFDAAILSQVLEHSREPGKWLTKLHGLLGPGGVAVVAVPNFSSIYTDVLGPADPYVCPPAHLNYFSPGNLAGLAQRCGFEVIAVETHSRVLRRAFRRRFGPLGGPAHALFEIASRPLDLVQKGNFLNAYLRRRG